MRQKITPKSKNENAARKIGN